MLETILLLILGVNIDSNIFLLIQYPAKQPNSYSFQWFFNNFWDEYIHQTTEVDKSSSDSSEDEKKIKSDPVTLFLHKTKNNKTIQLDELKNIYKKDDFKFENEHRKLSKALGILTINTLDNQAEILNQTPLFYSSLIKNHIINNNFTEEFRNNPIREIFFSFFTVNLFFIGNINFLRVKR